MNTYSSTPPDKDPKRSEVNYRPFLAENEAEVARLLLLHRRLSEMMGNILPTSLDLSQVHRVLDVGCGIGAWAYDLAWRHPDIEVVGIDKSAFFIEQAQKHIFGNIANITYMVQDMHQLEGEKFAPGSFDLIHMRFMVGDVSVQAFPALIRSLAQLCRQGGYFAWTEAEFPLTTSAAYQRLCELVLLGLRASGRAFAPGNSLGITVRMGRWLRDNGYRIVQNQAYGIEVSAGTKGHEMFARQAYVFGNQVRPFLLETKVTTATEFEEVFMHMQNEIRDESFCGLCFLRMMAGVKVTGRGQAAAPTKDDSGV
jgi:SAM-dependent methyltransferase